MSHTPSLRMPRQAAGIDRERPAIPAAASTEGVEPAFLEALLPLLYQVPPVHDAVDSIVDTVGSWFSGLFG